MSVMELCKKIESLMETDPAEALRLTREELPDAVRAGSAPTVQAVKMVFPHNHLDCLGYGVDPEPDVRVKVTRSDEWLHLGRLLISWRVQESHLREKLCGLTFEAAQKALNA